ncbi:hypothetical protein [Campylobacter concisus]|uniref:hypothetical protein n=1 Tax=Campylobacter concisus TaxID=199 RepID=UPI000D315213|nr:hypothetical protein [Campylobacter concisus]
MKKLTSFLTVALVLVGCGREPVVFNETNTFAFYNDFGLNIRMIVEDVKECPSDIQLSEITKYVHKDPLHRDPKITCTAHKLGDTTSIYYTYKYSDGKYNKINTEKITRTPTIPFFEYALGVDETNNYLLLRLNKSEVKFLGGLNAASSKYTIINEGNQLPLLGLTEFKDLFVIQGKYISYDNWRIYEPMGMDKKKVWYKLMISEIRNAFIFANDDSNEAINDTYIKRYSDIKYYNEFDKFSKEAGLPGYTTDRE